MSGHFVLADDGILTLSMMWAEVDVPEGPLEFAADTPRPNDAARFDIFSDPQDLNRGTFLSNALSGRYVVRSTEYVQVDGTMVLRLWYDPAPPD